ncbi:hypothetical protein M430DRAFT_15779 [Amorphotheca resinae ATCC 22711]|uniref:RlpA-like protein double-psi beta-barrel domain-containing protein n=1 Tax=Amorphotheca resinae ATCC 22711 TaxID=857342 RepID=A0A2T3B9N1_AMORE|nr:hypothetical protein M430DRAFT_15779 [Amorphotheca resinae ATCC 22711]PSS25032.1 hypothetical protein M430DRAFT_15779 [Amorphotheca resinae ATCC 22711]
MATHEIPAWEAPPVAAKSSIFRNHFLYAPSFDKVKSFFSRKSASDIQTLDKGVPVEGVPSSRKYCGLSRRTCIILLLVSIALVALIIGLAVGLTRKSSKAQDLPLPSNTGIFTGDLTYYSPGPGYGACGYENTSSDSICAVSHIIWDAASTSANPNNNPLCGKKIRITRYDQSVGGNRSVDVEVVDRCVGCKANDLDLSLKMFTSLADESLGRVLGSWAWLNQTHTP